MMLNDTGHNYRHTCLVIAFYCLYLSWSQSIHTVLTMTAAPMTVCVALEEQETDNIDRQSEAPHNKHHVGVVDMFVDKETLQGLHEDGEA